MFALGLMVTSASGDDETTRGPAGQAAAGTPQGAQAARAGRQGARAAPAVRADAACDGAFCITEPENGFPSGYCSGVCALPDGSCGAGSV